MLNITILPYLVFILMAIPPFILGYFKGWRSGVFTLVLTMLIGGMLVGIFFAIYDNALWPLFRNSFIKSHNPGGLDIETLKEISKHSVISISVGIMIIPTILVVWILYMVFKKILNKYMLPKLKKISPNEVKITRKNLKNTRIGGVVINGVTGLIVASATASAVATLSTPSNNSNFFHKIINGVSYGMTFGQAQYDVDYQKTFEFLSNGDKYKDEINMFRKLFELPQDSNGNFKINPADLSNFKALGKYTEFLEATNKIARNSKEISKALFLMFMNASTNKQPFNLVGFDSQLGAIDNADKNKVANREKNIATSVSALEKFVKNIQTNIKWNSEGVREGATQFFKSKFIDFEKSQYYQDWKKKDDEYKNAKKLLANMQKEDNDLKKSIPEDQIKQINFKNTIISGISPIKYDWKEITKLILKIGKGGVNNIPLPPKIMVMLQKQNWVLTNEDGSITSNKIFKTNILLNGISSPTNPGSFEKKEDAQKIYQSDEIKAESDEKVTEKDKKIFNDFNTLLNDLKINTSNKQSLITQKNNEQKNNANLKNDLISLNNALQVLSQKESAAMAKVNKQKIKSDASNLKYTLEVSKLKTTQAIFDAALLAEQTASNKNINLSIAEDELTKARNALNKNKENIKNYKITKDIDLSELNRLIKIHDGIKNNLVSKKNDISSKQSSINYSNQKISSFEQEINRYVSSLKVLNSKLTTLKNNVGTLNDARIKYYSSKAKSDASRILATKSKNNFNALNEIFQKQIDQIQHLEQQISFSEVKINTALNAEKNISNILHKNILRKLLLENNSTVKGSIKNEILIISKLKTSLDNLLNIKNIEHTNYNNRSMQIINSIVMAMS